MKPRADFVCLSKKCAVEGEAPTYELPVDATHCPAGHKRLTRLFNKVGVIGTRAVAPEADWRLTGTSLPRRADAMLTESYDHHAATRPARDMPALTAGPTEREVALPGGRKIIVPSATQAAGMLGVQGQGRAMKPLEIARMVRHDSVSVPAVLGYNRNGGRAPHAIPTVSAGRPKT